MLQGLRRRAVEPVSDDVVGHRRGRWIGPFYECKPKEVHGDIHSAAKVTIVSCLRTIERYISMIDSVIVGLISFNVQMQFPKSMMKRVIAQCIIEIQEQACAEIIVATIRQTFSGNVSQPLLLLKAGDPLLADESLAYMASSERDEDWGAISHPGRCSTPVGMRHFVNKY